MPFKLGRKPARRLLSTPALGDFLDKATTWPAVPPQGWEFAVPSAALNILGNDVWGNCLVEGTEVSGSGVRLGYKMPYCGPVIRICTNSGKRLTVTPNHAVLTPSGFALAKFLKQGDYLVGTRGSKPLPWPSLLATNVDFNDSPLPIQDVVSTLRLRTNLVRKVMPIPVNFHGDGEFVNGNVDIVGAERFLGSKLKSALSEPNGQYKVRPTRKLERGFHRSRSAFCRSLRNFSTSLRNVSLSRNRAALAYSHTGVSQSNSLSHGSHWMASSDNSFSEPFSMNSKLSKKPLHGFSGNVAVYGNTGNGIGSSPKEFSSISRLSKLHASGVHPSTDGDRVDAYLSGNLAESFPGLIESDCIVEIEENMFSGHVYDLSTDSQWYVANGIVTHNCAEAGALHLIQAQQYNVGKTVNPTEQDALNLYSAVTGFNPSDPSTDQGTALIDLLNYWKTTGITIGSTVHKIAGYASLDITSVQQMRYAAYTFGGSYLGIDCPNECETNTTNWNFAPGLPIAGGHCIIQTGEGAAGGTVDSWAMRIPASWQFLLGYIEEGYVVWSQDFVDLHSGKSPTGLDLAGLAAAGAAI